MPENLVKIAEGREAEMFAWEDGRILRLLRRPGDTASLEREAVVLDAARARGVRVPATFGVTVVDGRPGLIMERISGADLLTEIGRRPWKVFAIGATCGHLHAAVHEVPAPPDIRSPLSIARASSAEPGIGCRSAPRAIP